VTSSARAKGRDAIARTLLAAVCLCLLPALPAAAGSDADVDSVLEGFDDDDEVLDGFDDEGDAIDGFDDDGPDSGTDGESGSADEPFWDLSGSVALGMSINYLDHEAFAGVGETTDYLGVQRLRTRLNLQLDLDLPCEWSARISGFGYYDFAYLANGRDEYTEDTLDLYEWEFDFQEFWVQGNLLEDVDLKVGRQVVNWGRSDSLRVLDVLNPLDNREPGLTDIEDLRRTVSMVKLDYYVGDWSFTAIALPEMRFDLNPTLGNDFAPVVETLGTVETFFFPKDRPKESFHNTEWAGRIKGIFPGWDISLHGAYLWTNQDVLRPVLTIIPPDEMNPEGDFSFDGTVLRPGRFWMVGSGANYIVGSFLFKAEVAYLGSLDYTTSTHFMVPVGEEIVGVDAPTGNVERDRLDVMGGIEYYGFTNTTIALEIANRHIFGFRSDMRPLFKIREDSVETALRITRTFLREKLEVTALGIVYGTQAQDGSIVRLEARYDLLDALELGGGIVLYQRGDTPFFETIPRNDRIFLELRYSF